MKKKKSNKISLTEATILALQGKLELTEEKEIKNESIEVETDNTEVTVNDDSTVVETPEETITVEKKDTECMDCETSEEVIEVPEEDIESEQITTEVPEEINDSSDDTAVTDVVEPVENEEVEEPEEIEESKDKDKFYKRSIENIKNKIEKQTENLDLDKNLDKDNFETFEGFKEAVKARDGLYGLVSMNFHNIPGEVMKEIALNAIYELNNDGLIIADIGERVYNANTETTPKEECNDLDGDLQKTNYRFNESSFTKFISHNLSKKDENFESFKINKFLINENKLKIEGTQINKDKTTNDITFKFNKIQENKARTKYELETDKKEEGNTDKILLKTSVNKDNLIECKYFAKEITLKENK